MVGILQPVSKGCDYWECGICGSDLTFKLRPLFEKPPGLLIVNLMRPDVSFCKCVF